MKEIDAPRLKNARAFCDRVPFYWKRAPFYQKLYSEIGIFFFVLFSLMMLIPAGILMGAAGMYSLIAIPAFPVLVYTFQAIRILPHRAMTKAEFNKLSPNEYRLLDKADRKRLLPVAKLLHEQPDSELRDSFVKTVKDIHSMYSKDQPVSSRKSELDKLKELLDTEQSTLAERKENAVANAKAEDAAMLEILNMPQNKQLRLMLENR